LQNAHQHEGCAGRGERQQVLDKHLTPERILNTRGRHLNKI
jgi:hypothetical protein